jgi:hypothetical protein
VIQIDTELIAIGNAKVVDPTSDILAGFEQLVAHGYTPVSVGQSTNCLLELAQGFVAPLNAAAAEGESEELAFVGSDHSAFGGVDDQLQAVLQVTADAAQYAFTRPLTVYQDGKVIGVTGKPVSALF